MVKKIALVYANESVGDPVECNWMLRSDGSDMMFFLLSEIELTAREKAERFALLIDDSVVAMFDLSVLGMRRELRQDDTLTLVPQLTAQ